MQRAKIRSCLDAWMDHAMSDTDWSRVTQLFSQPKFDRPNFVSPTSDQKVSLNCSLRRIHPSIHPSDISRSFFEPGLHSLQLRLALQLTMTKAFYHSTYIP
jgi:hypothetical protein